MKDYPKIVLMEDEAAEGHNTFKVRKSKLASFESGTINTASGAFVETRNMGELTDKGLYLNSNYDWQIVKDKVGCTILIAIEGAD